MPSPSSIHQVEESPRPSASTGLTALHLAVINNDLSKVSNLLYSKEHAVNERTPLGATPIMLASLYGRHKMFIYLLDKTASLFKHDFEGFTCVDYAKHSDSIKPLLEKYKTVTHEKPRLSGRKRIADFLRPISSVIKQGGLIEKSETTENPQAGAFPGQRLERRVVFHRKVGMLEIVEKRCLAAAEWDFDLGRKTCAAVRSCSETSYLAIAISGWRGDVGKLPDALNSTNLQILKNDTYLNLIRDFRKIVGYKFKKNPFDDKWRGSANKAGAFLACHAEKQVAIFVLRECIAQVLGVRDCSLENMAKLKLAVGEETEGLQEQYIIELEHKPCTCCIRFLKLIQHLSGLQFKWVQREWFVKGKRSKLKPKRGFPVLQNTDEVDDFMDIIDVGDDDLQLVEDPDIMTSATATLGEHAGADADAVDDDNEDDDWVMVKRPGAQQSRQKREHEEPIKEGSEVNEADFSSPRPYLEKQITLAAQRKQQKNKTAAPNRPVLSPDTIIIDTSSSDTYDSDTSSDGDSEEVTAKQSNGPISTAERRGVPLNFEIWIPQARVESTSREQPFPHMTDFMSRWGASGQDN